MKKLKKYINKMNSIHNAEKEKLKVPLSIIL